MSYSFNFYKLKFRMYLRKYFFSMNFHKQLYKNIKCKDNKRRTQAQSHVGMRSSQMQLLLNRQNKIIKIKVLKKRTKKMEKKTKGKVQMKINDILNPIIFEIFAQLSAFNDGSIHNKLSSGQVQINFYFFSQLHLQILISMSHQKKASKFKLNIKKKIPTEEDFLFKQVESEQQTNEKEQQKIVHKPQHSKNQPQHIVKHDNHSNHKEHSKGHKDNHEASHGHGHGDHGHQNQHQHGHDDGHGHGHGGPRQPQMQGKWKQFNTYVPMNIKFPAIVVMVLVWFIAYLAVSQSEGHGHGQGHGHGHSSHHQIHGPKSSKKAKKSSKSH